MARPPKRVREPATVTYEARIDRNGRIVIPASVRKQLGVSPGDEVLLQVGRDQVRLTTMDAAVRSAQDAVRRYVPKGPSLVAALIAMRRAEVERE